MPRTSSLPDVLIYTDGACDPNPGPGGWAAILKSGTHEKVLRGADPDTTNNRMELQAVIAALGALKQPSRVRLHTDSRYVRKGVTEWLEGWKAKSWKNVANRDLWEALGQAMQRHVIEWQWVKGHAGNPLNERVDRLAVGMIPRAELPLEDRDAAHLFTGVSFYGPNGPGGWAVVIRENETVRELSGYEAQTSANRLHLLAAARGLEAVPPELSVHLYTPSDYVAQGAQQRVRGWAVSGWRTKDGQPVKHRELWQAIMDSGDGRQVRWHGLKDGMRPIESLRADELARKAARRQD